jgi:hypothetical protein
MPPVRTDVIEGRPPGQVHQVADPHRPGRAVEGPLLDRFAQVVVVGQAGDLEPLSRGRPATRTAGVALWGVPAGSSR